MAEIVSLEPMELFNLLNQRRSVPRLAEINYLCLIDAREAQDYYASHIVVAKNAKKDPNGLFMLPEAVEVDSMQHVVVYDGSTSSPQEPGRALDCARTLAEVSRFPVGILRGGFQLFSALYHFLRTEKILYTIAELENLNMYPVEVIAGLLYMGDQNQAMDSDILRDLKIRAIVSLSLSDPLEGNHSVLNIPVADSVDSDLYSSFEKICTFIGSRIELNSRVLIVSKQGRSRCSTVTIAFLMHHLKNTLEEAWRSTLRCKPSMRPNTGFLEQLSDWELHTKRTKLTDISQPHF
ncbi:serine/threonine/tyrosine-interacting-like protein 1 [Brachyistius frenatus]|uniref:serine/threonine/tyrosine-interacting-like protein 1 n=1 Tax=Brachyistius frenatus TaxID=100188 RepID=UPI0037E8BA9D